MDVLVKENREETVVKNSRFIAELFPVTDQKSARDKLREVKELYSDATHVVHAFVVGLGAETCGMSDDGEPSGTAGRPVLDVLRGSGMTNALLTVTRYFGGTLLGTGGLVKAYGDAAKLVISSCRREEYVAKKSFSLEASYGAYEDIKRAFLNFNISDIQEEYGEQVRACGLIYADQALGFADQVRNLTKGKTCVAITDL